MNAPRPHIITDCHTHTPAPGAVVNFDPVSMGRAALKPGLMYSAGIHPWNAGCARPADLKRLEQLAGDPRVVAIGETGLDSVHVAYEWVKRGNADEITQALPDLQRQLQLLQVHIGLSERTGKPLLLHVVKRYPEILALRLKLRPTQPWIIHGFRGKPGLARELIDKGFCLSYGERFNPLSVAVTPPGRMLAETDESTLPIDEIVRRLGVTPAGPLTDLASRQMPGIAL